MVLGTGDMGRKPENCHFSFLTVVASEAWAVLGRTAYIQRMTEVSYKYAWQHGTLLATWGQRAMYIS